MKRAYTISSRHMITFYLQKRMKPLEKGTKKKQKKNCNYWLSPSYSVVLAFIYRLYTENNYNICFK
ncbi:hypothetical protein [Ectobacillus funiculus]|uniref:Uncharacterized protein n=1 Tax=Ectobacillus funiculus TaxID=137993 RepID=A0ABV5WAP9_9BACI